MGKEEVVYIYNGILAITKNEILPFAMMWMELENIMLSEISQSGKDKYHMLSLICGIFFHMWNLRNKTEDHRAREEKIKQDEIREGDKP